LFVDQLTLDRILSRMSIAKSTVGECRHVAKVSRHGWFWWWAGASVVFFLLMLAVLQLTGRPFVDHDLYHEMALWRAALVIHHVPKHELFSFTPTVDPCVQHEWGTGAILYYVTRWMGGNGLALLRGVLFAGTLVVIFLCARIRARGMRGMGDGVAGLALPLLATAPLYIMLLGIALSPVRAQMFTMLFLAVQFYLLELDRRGNRWWPLVWIPMYVAWLNLHAGFVLGPIFLGAYWLEQVIQTRRPRWLLIATGLAAVPLVLVNPYGANYVPYLWRAISMPRPMIGEWLPLWNEPLLMAYFAFMVLLAVYATARRGGGWQALPGVLVLGCLAIESLLHTRHAPLFAIAWACYVPSTLVGTPLALLMARLWSRFKWLIGPVCACAGVAMVIYLPAQPLRVRLSVSTKDKIPFQMPVGAVAYLRENEFVGNLMTPFSGSSYVMWHLGPRVKIGMDSRYEVAYQPGVFEKVAALYKAQPGWEETLGEYRPQLTLVPVTSPLSGAMAQSAEWVLVYQDDAYQIFSPPTHRFPVVDRRGIQLDDTFP
jgi:hypothetical protein